MSIFLKYVLKSMTEKKGRFILLIAAVALSTGLLIASIGTVDIAIDALVSPARESCENKEISIVSSGEERFFDCKALNETGVKNIVKELEIQGIFNDEDKDESIKVNFHGRKSDDIENYSLIDGSLSDFEGEKCIISKRISKEENVNVGDNLEVVLAGHKVNLEVCAVGGNEGLFYSDTSSSFQLIVPYEYLAEKLDVNGKYNVILCDKDKDTVKESVDAFNDDNDSYKASQLIDEDAIKSESASFTQILYFMLLIVVLMSAIIIYSSFKLIITERIPVIGTFLSVGARKKTIERILYIESIFYGIIGAVLGSSIGVAGLNLISRIISPLKEYGIYEKADIKLSYIVIGVIFAIVLSFLSSLIPIKRIRKLEIKEVILNTIDESADIGWKKFILGVILIAVCIAFSFSNSEFAKALSALLILLTFVGVICIYPKLVDILSSVFYKILRGKSKTVLLAINNLRTSKVLIGNISLIVISIMSVFMISSLGTSISKYVVGVYEEIDYDIEISRISTINNSDNPVSDEIIKKIEDTEGYEEGSMNPIYYESASFNDSDSSFNVNAIEPEKYKEGMNYFEFDKEPNKESYEALLKHEDGIVISTLLSKKNNLKKGDTCTITIENIKKDVKVLGTFDAKLFNNGYLVLMNKSFLEKEWGFKGYNDLNFRTYNDPEEFKESIKELGKDYGVNIRTKDEELKMNNENNAMIINILNIFSYMAMIIASLGVISNISIGFIQRKRSLAVLSSVGMNRGNRNKMLIFESIFTVIWAVLISIPGTMVTVRLLTLVLEDMDFAMKVSVDYSLIPLYCVSAIIIVLIATIPVLLRSRKLSVVNELKYE